MSAAREVVEHPPELFKFRPYSLEEEKRRVRDILVDNHLHFSTPESFNDPFDPRPVFVADDEKEFLNHYKRRAAERGLEWNLDMSPKEAMATLTEKYRTDFKARFRILSLSASRDETLLWSHYAGNHRGVCIHFDFRVIPFPVAQPVEYTNDYPVISFPIKMDFTKQFVRMFCTKATSWSYEREYRIVLFPEDFDFDGRLMWSEWTGASLRLSRNAVSGITLGALMGEAEKREIIDLAVARDPVPPLWQAELHNSAFALSFNRIAL